MFRSTAAAVLLLGGLLNGGLSHGQPRGSLPLTAGQSMLEADAVLISSGWRPAPQQQPLALDQQRAGVLLTSLSACSGTGLGFCRFDYRRNNRQLSVVTLPRSSSSEALRSFGGVVNRWWVETLPAVPSSGGLN